ncbi:phage tail protein [Proteus mirabilis]|uniref:phage tail-collar fiber domain-containing protein n=1 Tax=Proteus mirabilis TaxID=584 RepID=UPI000A6FDAD7|nr:phage tail protein [Proteus mirabilis]EIT1737194.1 phage tail protein [Proteus mirabilis]EJG2208841.1 phage tail protein [Proteus mirabilis]EKU2369572.1 phage tail protein [Proteus mirabilis]EKU7916160.1 phage tail protein [Proteus mirabilis]EKU7920039.1 phage tail protein [Proteus mirabilis]
MSAKFFALLTVIGANKLAKATALGTTLKITQMAVGDGGGTLPMPSAEQTKLVNEKRRAGINTLFIDSKNANQIVAEQVIPENEGGYWIREIGLFDDEGSLIAVGNCPETYKPQLQEGSGRTQTIRMILTVSHTESVELKVDPSVILATRESVDNAIEIASKSILDTVEKEYATKDEVKKKFDNSNIVHEKGASKEKVISQKGVTDLFQPKGNYQPAGNYVTTATFNLEINKKIDKASLSQQLGNDVNKVPSLDLVTKELGKKQASGNYADKSSSNTQSFSAPIEAITKITALSADKKNSVALNVSNEGSAGIEVSASSSAYHRLPKESGTLVNENYGYSKTEASLKFQPLGNYADKNSQYRQSFSGSLFGTTLVGVNSENNLYSIQFVAYNDGSLYIRKEANKVTHDYKLPNKAGVFALEGDSYTTTQSDNKYQLKGNYADKSSTAGQNFNGPIYATNNVGARVGERRIKFELTAGKPEITHTDGVNGWRGAVFPDKTGTLALTSDIDEVNNIPVGSPIPWSLATAPSGYLICNGQTFNKSTYPKLAVAYPSGKLPDLRGEFIRGLDSGRGIDAGRSVLSAQKGNSLLSSNIFGGLSSSESNKWHKAINYIGITGTDNDGGYGVHQQIEGANGNETRPRNIAFLYIVRAA